MKRLLALCVALVIFASCSIDDGEDFTKVFVPVESVEIPDEFELGKIYSIEVNYLRPSTCHSFNEFYYLIEGNERIVAPINYAFEGDDCQILEDKLVKASFPFKVISTNSYIFKFWKGNDTEGKSEYLTIEVPVVQ
ncbi:hypothetical protein [Flavivirga eckloniae]|uniref:Lipoprotein n=1 Tax=Flavivirga eckloniae TaxID=1803846 RepID=A0A2K9PR75_9FLAO|nr:hypothetical protein [Flavivirga eckloniae]AUP79328.1 hypothetical protein C1H87_11665 [Flavivirga eckloniae]